MKPKLIKRILEHLPQKLLPAPNSLIPKRIMSKGLDSRNHLRQVQNPNIIDFIDNSLWLWITSRVLLQECVDESLKTVPDVVIKQDLEILQLAVKVPKLIYRKLTQPYNTNNLTVRFDTLDLKNNVSFVHSSTLVAYTSPGPSFRMTKKPIGG